MDLAPVAEEEEPATLQRPSIFPGAETLRRDADAKIAAAAQDAEGAEANSADDGISSDDGGGPTYVLASSDAETLRRDDAESANDVGAASPSTPPSPPAAAAEGLESTTVDYADLDQSAWPLSKVSGSVHRKKITGLGAKTDADENASTPGGDGAWAIRSVRGSVHRPDRGKDGSAFEDTDGLPTRGTTFKRSKRSEGGGTSNRPLSLHAEPVLRPRGCTCVWGAHMLVSAAAVLGFVGILVPLGLWFTEGRTTEEQCRALYGNVTRCIYSKELPSVSDIAQYTPAYYAFAFCLLTASVLLFLLPLCGPKRLYQYVFLLAHHHITPNISTRIAARRNVFF